MKHTHTHTHQHETHTHTHQHETHIHTHTHQHETPTLEARTCQRVNRHVNRVGIRPQPATNSIKSGSLFKGVFVLLMNRLLAAVLLALAPTTCLHSLNYDQDKRYYTNRS